jgi:single-strand DNA-binding protein
VDSFTLAVTPRRPDGQGGWENGETSFLRCTAWRGMAEHVADSLSKGDRVMVYGTLRQRSWETPRATSAPSSRFKPTRSGPACAGPRQARAGPPGAARRHQQGRPVQRRAAVLDEPTRGPGAVSSAPGLGIRPLPIALTGIRCA